MAAQADWRRQEALHNDVMIRAVDPEFSGRMVCPITRSGRVVPAVKREEALTALEKGLFVNQRKLEQQQEQERRRKEGSLASLPENGVSGPLSQPKAKPVSLAQRLRAQQQQQQQARGRVEMQTMSEQFFVERGTGSLSGGELKADSGAKYQSQHLKMVRGASSQSLKNECRKEGEYSNGDPYSQMSSLYAPAYRGGNPLFATSSQGNPSMSPGGAWDSPAGQCSTRSSASTNWEPSYSPASSTGRTSPGYSPRSSFPPSPVQDASPGYTKSFVYSYNSPAHNASSRNLSRAQYPDPPARPAGPGAAYRPEGSVPFGGRQAAAVAAAAAAAAAAAETSRARGSTNMNCPEAQWLRDQQLRAKHEQYLQAQKGSGGGGGGGGRTREAGRKEQLLLRVGSNAASECASSEQASEEGGEFDFSDIVSDCINFSDVESACKKLDSEKTFLDGVSITALSATRFSEPGAPALVLYALYVDGRSAPMLPGNSSTQMLFPQSLQRAAAGGKEQRAPAPVQQDENGWVHKAKPSIAEYASYKSATPGDELEAYLFG